MSGEAAAGERDDRPGAPDPDVVAAFAPTLIEWQREHGRQTLPWQQLGDGRDAYRIWLAEIMLQQTQVAAVVPFYRRFVERFPDVAALAASPIDDVMQCWSGLGYYSRARNLHAAARRVMDVFGGRFPDSVDALESLPGVGRSTAGAIAAFGYGRRAPILDGNVRRVLARVFAIPGSPADVVSKRRLWALSDALLPDADIERYTQGLMDLGATICTPRRPACLVCPFERVCIAHRESREEALPERATRKPVPVRRATLLLATCGATVLLERRPPVGIWGGLWSLPEAVAAGAGMVAPDRAADDADVVARMLAGPETIGPETIVPDPIVPDPIGSDPIGPVTIGPVTIGPVVREPGFVHAFTHFVLEADLMRVEVLAQRTPRSVRDAAAAVGRGPVDAMTSESPDAAFDGAAIRAPAPGERRWVALDSLATVGLPSPVRTLLARVFGDGDGAER